MNCLYQQSTYNKGNRISATVLGLLRGLQMQRNGLIIKFGKLTITWRWFVPEPNLPCAELKKIAVLVKSAARINVDIAEHAKSCVYCIFWLSRVLAINKAFFETSRAKFNDCQARTPIVEKGEIEEIIDYPPKNCFRDLLIIDAQDEAEHDEAVSEYASEAAGIFLTEKEECVLQTLEHLTNCALCGNYFCELKGLMVKYQKRYEDDIKNNRPIEPVVADSSQEFVISREWFIMSQVKEPNS